MQGTFKREDRTYHVSDERLAAFKALTPAQRLAWVEQMATFLRKAAIARSHQHIHQPEMDQPPHIKPT